MKDYQTSCTSMTEIQFNYKRSLHIIRTLHMTERKKFAFCAFGLSQVQENVPAV